eukprot:COSAG01_NODE_25094_length_756_cov_0.908676_2_plen_100_part_01
MCQRWLLVGRHGGAAFIRSRSAARADEICCSGNVRGATHYVLREELDPGAERGITRGDIGPPKGQNVDVDMVGKPGQIFRQRVEFDRHSQSGRDGDIHCA